MHVSVRVRVFFARHRWMYWLFVAVLAGTVGVAVQTELRRVEAARSEGGTTSAVLIAEGDQVAGLAPQFERSNLPDAMVPESALREMPVDAVLRQRVADGEVLTRADITAVTGPAAGAAVDTIVVGIVDPLARGAVVGARVQVTSEGIILAAQAEVVSLADDIVFVAVAPTDAPMIAAAAQRGIASIVFVP